MQSSTQPTLPHHVRDITVLFEHGSSAFMMTTKTQRCYQGGGHDFRIVHLTLAVFVMMHGFQQIVTQAECRYDFVVHGLAPLAVKWVISSVM
jgi:hypothetical protein